MEFKAVAGNTRETRTVNIDLVKVDGNHLRLPAPEAPNHKGIYLRKGTLTITANSTIRYLIAQNLTVNGIEFSSLKTDNYVQSEKDLEFHFETGELSFFWPQNGACQAIISVGTEVGIQIPGKGHEKFWFKTI